MNVPLDVLHDDLIAAIVNAHKIQLQDKGDEKATLESRTEEVVTGGRDILML